MFDMFNFACCKYNTNKITNLIVINKEKYVGMIHIHDIIKIGL